LPVSASGKLDRSALPAPPTDRPEVATGYRPPLGERETLLAALWSQLLGVERVGRDDSFFELGGDSILGIRMIARARRAGVELTVPQLFRHQTIAALAALAAPEPVAAPPAVPVDSTSRFPLTPLQREMLREAASAPGRGLYVVPAEAVVDGNLDPDALRAAFTRLAAHHPILRTSVDPVSHTVHARAEPVFRVEDWREVPDAEQRRRRRELIEQEWRDGFDPGTAPLSRLSVVRLGERRHSLLWTRHNVLLDGWSFARLFDDLLRLHAALRDGTPQPALVEPAPFAGYVDWLARHADRAATQLDGGLLGGRPKRLFEPEAGPAAGPYRELRMPLPAHVEPFVHRQRLTLSTVLEAAWAIVLARRTGSQDVRFGLVFSTRPAELPGIESAVGLLINTLPSAVRVPAGTPVLGWLHELRERAVRMQELSAASLPVLRQRHGPLWDTLLLLHNYPHGFDGTLPGDLTLVDTQGFSQVGAAVTVSVDPRPLRLAMLFDPDRATEAAVRGLGTDLAAALAAMVADPDRPVGEVLR
ncbi:MAG TPA: condensation domain-containing protein, partial [Pseudonocardiaceae bacterium]|nr:condensation domain-containing protein [Pseudonocardiaceae bacterium]